MQYVLKGLTVSYKYDGLGRRIQRTTSAGASERYVYDGQDVLLDLNADWSVAATYLNGPGIDNHLRQTSGITGLSYYLMQPCRQLQALLSKQEKRAIIFSVADQESKGKSLQATSTETRIPSTS